MGFFKSLAVFFSGDVDKAKEELDSSNKQFQDEETTMLIEHLQGGLDVLYQESILPEERVSVRLQGCMGEALVVTDRRALVLKAGYPAGSPFARTYREFSLKEITSIGCNCGLDRGLVQIIGDVVPEDNHPETRKYAKNIVNFPIDKANKFQKAVQLLNERVNRCHSEKDQEK
jgi:hypothetical protein